MKKLGAVALKLEKYDSNRARCWLIRLFLLHRVHVCCRLNSKQTFAW